MSHQLFDGNIRIFNAGDGAVDDFLQIMGRNISRHTDSDAGCAVEQQKWNACCQQRRLLQRFVIVGHIINRFFFQIGQHFIGNARQAAFRITHGRGRITVNRTEVALSVHQHVAQRKLLGHTHHGVVNGRVTVRMIFTHDLADDTGGFFVGFVIAVAHFIHGI